MHRSIRCLRPLGTTASVQLGASSDHFSSPWRWHIASTVGSKFTNVNGRGRFQFIASVSDADTAEPAHSVSDSHHDGSEQTRRVARLQFLQMEQQRLSSLIEQEQTSPDSVEDLLEQRIASLLRSDSFVHLMTRLRRRGLSAEGNGGSDGAARQGTQGFRASIKPFARFQARELSPAVEVMLLNHDLAEEACHTLVPLYVQWLEGPGVAFAAPDGAEAPPTHVGISDRKAIQKLLDMTLPHKWYPLARSMQRKVHVHVGPTNSGKTFAALQALKLAKSGAYCGPLRLLAWEVQEKLLAQGVACNLVTGQELVQVDGATHISSTVEMADVGTEIDCVVIDELQMIGSEDRGSAWTRALLGMPARDVHVCGDFTMLSLVKELCHVTGEELHVHEYKRLSPLKFSPPLSAWSQIKRGDCVVAFSRKDIYTLKRRIEKNLGLKCCVVYGSLPPETRKAQAELFNAPDNGYDVLVASDAVGMGLNLNIRRVIFSSVEKFDGTRVRKLLSSEVRQIGGRAGRFRSEFPTGYLTTLDPREYEFLQNRYGQEPRMLERAGLAPSFESIEAFARQLPHVPFAVLLSRFCELSTLDGLYFMCSMDTMLEAAKVLEGVPLSIRDRFAFCQAPLSNRDSEGEYLRQYAEEYVGAQSVEVGVHVPSKVPTSASALEECEEAHALLDLYIWLARRFPDAFEDLEQAQRDRDVVARLIEAGLETMSERAVGVSAADASAKPWAQQSKAHGKQQKLKPAIRARV